jgi:hypothetical protein
VIGLHLVPGFAQICWGEDPLQQIVTQGWGDDRSPRRRCRARACLLRVCPPSSLSSLFGPSLSGRERAASYSDLC